MLSFSFIAQVMLSGLAQGGLYALAALGLVIIYNATDVLNFAEGPLGAVGAFLAWKLTAALHLPFAAALLLALLFAFCLGMLAQMLIFGRMRQTTTMMQTVATLGLFMFVEGLLGLIFGFNPKALEAPAVFRPRQLGELVLQSQDQLILAIVLVSAVGLVLFFRHSRVGLAMRGIVQNGYAIRLMGVPVGRIKAFAWGAGCMLGALTAMLAAPITAITPDMMNPLVVYAFAAAIVGGFGSLPGALIGAILLGVFNNLVQALVAPELSLTFVFLLVAAVLALRPSGLFGRQLVQKV